MPVVIEGVSVAAGQYDNTLQEQYSLIFPLFIYTS